MGAAATKRVISIVADIIMPIVGIVTPDGNWREAILPIGPAKSLNEDFIGAIFDFLIIACVIFLTVKYVMKGNVSKKIYNFLSNLKKINFTHFLEFKKSPLFST